MDERLTLKKIATAHNDFPTKFGLPRQSGLIDELISVIEFEPEYRRPEALRELEGFSHIWLIWGFTGFSGNGWSPTVRPPRLGGNKRLGVFATRSPNRPNPLGLSCVALERIVINSDRGPLVYIRGGDMMNGTAIYDIKPYLPFADSYPLARGGFAQNRPSEKLEVIFPQALLGQIPPQKRPGLLAALAQDPRPAYHHDPDRVYGFVYGGLEIQFIVEQGHLSVRDVYPAKKEKM